MNSLNKLIVASCFYVSSIVFAADVHDVVDMTIEIVIDPSYASAAMIGNQGKTGFSPSRTKARVYGLDSPLRKLFKPTVTLKKNVRRRLFNPPQADVEQEAKDKNVSASSSAVFVTSEIHKVAGNERESAQDVQLPSKTVEQPAIPEIASTTFELFDSQTTTFVSGKKAYVDPCCLSGSVLVDCDHEHWNAIISAMLPLINVDTQENFLASFISAINNNINELKKFAYFNSRDKVLECRHFATISLPVFSKLMERETIPFRGTIQFLGANAIAREWKITDGHAWNLVKIIEDGTETLWLVDVYNFLMVNLSKARFLKDHEVIRVAKDGTVSREGVSYSDWYYPYLVATREKMGLKTTRKKVLYKDEDAMKQLSEKVLSQMKRKEHVSFEAN